MIAVIKRIEVTNKIVALRRAEKDFDILMASPLFAYDFFPY